MSVLIEAISVVFRAETVHAKYPGGWEKFVENLPNQTMCADNELVRIGFMSPEDVKNFVAQLEDHGFTYIDNGEAQDIVVVDQIRGPMASCNWAKFARFDLDGDGKKMIVVGRLVGSDHDILMLPDGWDFENSLSATYSFVPTKHFEKSMTPIRNEGNLEVYQNELTGREAYIGRATPKDTTK